MPALWFACCLIAYFVATATVRLLKSLRPVPVGYQDRRGFHYGRRSIDDREW